MDEKIEQEIKPHLKKSVQFKTIIADFAAMTRMEDYQKVIGEGLKGVNVSMLFLNAGYA
jgi:hypothetical protein